MSAQKTTTLAQPRSRSQVKVEGKVQVKAQPQTPAQSQTQARAKRSAKKTSVRGPRGGSAAAKPAGRVQAAANVRAARTGKGGATGRRPVKPVAKPLAKPLTGPLAGKAEVLSSRLSYKGKVFTVTTDTVTEPGGVTSRRDVVRHSGSVVVLAVDGSANPRDPSILIERQYRHAAGKFLLELPAGRIEPGELALKAAKRELIEETGFRARRWSKLVRYFASPGFLAEHMQVFLAEEIRAGKSEPEADELIELLHIPLSELLGMIEAGKIEDGKTILSVLLYASRRDASSRRGRGRA